MRQPPSMFSRAWWRRFQLEDDKETLPTLSPGSQGTSFAERFDSARSLLADLPRTWRARARPSYAQQTMLILMAFETVMYVLAYQWAVTRLALYPFSIASTVFHEFGHAAATVLTGGSVESIRVAPDHSGLTRYRGGWRCAVLPAGYVGSTAVGAVLLFAAFGRRPSRWAAGALVAVMVLTLLLARDPFTVFAAALLAALLVWAAWRTEGRYCRHAVSVIGVVCSFEACLSILSTTVFATIDESDAAVFASECSILVPAFVYGVLWFALSVGLVAAALVSALVFFK